MVPPASDQVTRVRSYSGATYALSASPTGVLPSLLELSNPIRSHNFVNVGGPQPQTVNNLVWPLSLSLAATQEIDFSFSS